MTVLLTGGLSGPQATADSKAVQMQAKPAAEAQSAGQVPVAEQQGVPGGEEVLAAEAVGDGTCHQDRKGILLLP